MRLQRDFCRPRTAGWWGMLAFSVLVVAGSHVSAGEFPLENARQFRLMKARVQAAQFLSKATFGPTQTSINELADRIRQIGYKRATGEWIDYQFDLPMTSHQQTALDIIATDGNEPDMESGSPSLYRYQAWWHVALTSEDQLRQRVAWALSQIFVIGDSGQGFNNNGSRNIGLGERSIVDWLGMSDYYDMLARNATGTYRGLLEDVTFHPNMGTWLSSEGNRKADVAAGRFPDENYAREIMQLFSVGLYEMHPDGRFRRDDNGALIPTYDNVQIKELARLFTGFRFQHNDSTRFNTGRNFGKPMQVFVDEHDNNYDYSEEPNAPASKTVFGVTLPPLPQTLTEEAVKAEIGAGLDAIADHPNVAPFISRLLIQRLVKSNPSRGYLRRVTRKFNDNGQGVRGDMRAVVKAILTDPELYRGQRVTRRRDPLRLAVIPRGTEYSRLREPINRVTALIRAMRPSSDYPGGFMMLNHNLRDDLGQMPFRSPSVFNYYLPDFQPPGDLIGYRASRRYPYEALFAPEFQILNAVTANRTLNLLRRFANDRRTNYGMREGRCRISFDLEPEIELARDLDNLDEILKRFDLLLCNGTMSEETKTSIKDAVIAESEGRDWMYRERVETMLHAVIISPDCAVEQ